MKTFKEYLQSAVKEKKAIGHFNISNIEGFWAVVKAREQLSKELNQEIPVIIGVSEGERDFIGSSQVKALVDSYVKDTNSPVFLNSDHTYSFEKAKEVIDLKYDSIVFDGTELPFDQNIEETKRVVEYARKNNPEMLIEVEIGFIGKSSKILDTIPEGVNITEEFLTKPEEAKIFVEKTGIGLLAPAVGNIHGMLKGGKDPALNINRIKEISQLTKTPLVLHGGSGNSREDFSNAIESGVAIVHVNTELRLAFRDSLKVSLDQNPSEIAPYKLTRGSVTAMQSVIVDKLKIFNRI